MAERGGSALERAGLRLFGGLLRLLPEELRATAGAEMAATFAARQRDARARGIAVVVALWLREGVGLLTAAVRARLPGGRDPRGAPAALGEGLGQDLRYVLRS